MEERKRYPVEFRGGQWWSVVPMLIFLVFCVVYFVGYKVFDMNALAVGGFLGLLIGALFANHMVPTGMRCCVESEAPPP